MKCENFERKTFDERVQITRKAQLCHNCFQYGHIARGCLTKSACQVHGCNRRHNTLLHLPYQQGSNVNQVEESVTQTTQIPQTSQDARATQAASLPLTQGGQSNTILAESGKVCRRIMPVKVRSRDSNKELLTHALLDNGSDVSLCAKDLAAQLGIEGEQRTFFLTTQEKQDSPKFGQEISLKVEAIDGSDKLEIQRLWTVEKVNASSYSIPTDQDIRRLPHLQDIILPSIDETKVDLIIGCNVPEAF